MCGGMGLEIEKGIMRGVKEGLERSWCGGGLGRSVEVCDWREMKGKERESSERITREVKGGMEKSWSGA